MTVGPFLNAEEYFNYVQQIAVRTDAKYYAVVDTALNKAVGTFSLMRIDSNNGVIEVGAVAFSSLLRKTYRN